MTACLFCNGTGPFTTREHIIPESLGNDELVLENEVCDRCQAYFGKEIEQFVLSKSPIAFWRTYLGIRTKRNRLPSVNLSNPPQEKGVLSSTHKSHDNSVGFTAHEDGSTSVDIDDPQIMREILTGERDTFRFVMTPKILHMFARFLLKIGVELLCSADKSVARSNKFDDARSHARFGTGERLWPIFHFSSGDIKKLRRLRSDEEGVLEVVDCYEYSLLDVGSFTLLRFSMGTDHWITSLSHRYPDPSIKIAFPDNDLKLISYPDIA